jgi:hypothetical protein
LAEKQKYYIKKYKTKCPGGYNITNGGFGVSGITVLRTTRKKISTQHRKNREETRERLMKLLQKRKLNIKEISLLRKLRVPIK